MKIKLFNFILIGVFGAVCTMVSQSNQQKVFQQDFNRINNRVWIGEEFWAVPMEDWRVQNGRIECFNDRGNSRVNILTQELTGQGNIEISVKTGVMDFLKKAGSVGFTIGLQDNTDNDIRSLCYFG